ncbi:MAG TPA: hypothetical protein VFL93_07020 [Longimicrobiaceae bacterium]|nr:hypothetical protein [Longimicrobiaceae bacterium]
MRNSTGRWSAELALQGIRTRFEADDPALLAAALAPYRAWRHARPREPASPLRLRLLLGRGDAAAGAPELRVSGAGLSLRAPGVRGAADAHARTAWCVVTRDLLADPDRLAAEVVDPLVLFLLTRAGRVPLHAAGVVMGDTAVVLAGPSGVGKSTLALAARRAGLRVLSDDAVHVQLDPRMRVWGLPRPIHLLPHTPLEPHEGGAVPRLRAGRWKLAVPLEEDPPCEPVAERAVLFLLERGPIAHASQIGPDEALARILGALEPGFDHFREEIPVVVRALAAGGAWRLRLSPDPGEGLAALREVIGRPLSVHR